MHSLCIADHLGVLESIEHIASEHHERNRPPPPPHVSLPQPRQHSTHSRSEPSEKKISLDQESSSPEHVHLSSSTNHIPDLQTDNKELKDLDELYSEIVENTLAKNELLIRSEVGRNESTNYSFVEPRNIKSSLCNDGRILSKNCHLYSNQSESCNAVTDINNASSSIENNGPSDSTSDNHSTSRSRCSPSKKIVYYGIGAGTFLY